MNQTRPETGLEKARRINRDSDIRMEETVSTLQLPASDPRHASLMGFLDKRAQDCVRQLDEAFA